MIQWLRLHSSTARDVGLIPGRGAKITHAACSQKEKRKMNKIKLKYNMKGVIRSNCLFKVPGLFRKQ